MMVRCLLCLSAISLLAATAHAQVRPENAAKFAEVFAEVEAIFGGRDAFQTAYDEARAEQARMEGALQLSLNLEARFRANNSIPSADIYLKAANALKPSVENLRDTFTKFDALDSPLDEARARAAHDAVASELAVVYQKPMTEQFEYSKALVLKEEPLKAVQTATGVLVAVAHKKPG